MSYDPDDNIDVIKSYVEEHPDERDAVLAAERDGQNRVTLIAWLEGQDDTAEATPEPATPGVIKSPDPNEDGTYPTVAV
jgi:hypothetical protein